MRLTESVDRVVEWLNQNVCTQIKLKKPNDQKNDSGYEVEFVMPSAFPLYVPGKEQLAPSVTAPIPSVCVQPMKGNDNLLEKKRELEIRLCLACWNPGRHGDEEFHAVKNLKAVGGYSYIHTKKDAAQSYVRNMEGWKDAFNFADIVLRELENTEFIDGLRIKKESGIKFGLFTEEGDICDYYPYWHNWIIVNLESGIVTRTPKTYSEFL